MLEHLIKVIVSLICYYTAIVFVIYILTAFVLFHSTSTEKGRFNTKLQEGPYNYTVFKCTDPDLVTVNSRGAVTVTVINDLLCIAVNNSK